MPPVGFEPRISAGERPKTYALERAASGNGLINILENFINITYLQYFEFLQIGTSVRI